MTRRYREEIQRIRGLIKALRPHAYGPTIGMQRFDDAGPVVAELVLDDFNRQKYEAIARVAEKAAEGPGVFSAAFSSQAWLWREKNPGDTAKYAAAGMTKPSQMPDRFEGIVVAVMAYDLKTAGAAFRIVRGRSKKGRPGKILDLEVQQEFNPDSVVKSGLLLAFWQTYYASRMARESAPAGQA